MDQVGGLRNGERQLQRVLLNHAAEVTWAGPASTLCLPAAGAASAHLQLVHTPRPRPHAAAAGRIAAGRPSPPDVRHSADAPALDFAKKSSSTPRTGGTIGKRFLEIGRETRLSYVAKLGRKLRARCRMHSGTRQSSPGTMRQIGNLEFIESVLITDLSHLFHSPVRCPGSLQRNRKIRNRQSILPVSNDAGPDAVAVQKRTAEPHGPNHQVPPGPDALVDAIEVESAQIDLDWRSFPEPLRITATHDHVKVIGSDANPYRGADRDHRDYVWVVPRSIQEGRQPLPCTIRRPPSNRALLCM